MNKKAKNDILHFLQKVFVDDGILKTVFEGGCTLLVIALFIVFIQRRVFNLWDSIELNTAVTVSFTMLIAGMLRYVGDFIERKLEDSTKLTEDYESLLKLYGYGKQNGAGAETFIEFQNETADQGNLKHIAQANSECREKNQMPDAYAFPVVKMFPVSDRTKLEIRDSQDMYELPAVIMNNFMKLFQAHKHSNIYNNLNIRLKDYACAGDTVTLYTERTTYFKSMVTNRAMDAPMEDGLTVRRLFQLGHQITPLKYSQLSNHLGFNIMIETSDGLFVFVRRNSKVSIGKDTLGTSVGASLKTMYALENGEFTLAGLEKAVRGEIKDELGLTGEFYDYSNEKNIIAGYRDLVEGGKPQFLIYIKLKKSALDVWKRFSGYAEDNPNTKAASQEEQMKRDGDKLVFIRMDEPGDFYLTPDCISWRATGAYSQIPEKAELRGEQHAAMVPSASASVAMVLRYRKMNDVCATHVQ